MATIRGNVTLFNGTSTLPTNPDLVIEALPKMDVVVICGMTADGEFYFASSEPDAGDVLFYFERAKRALMQAVDDLEAEANG